jgi:hypothetical protein
LRWYTITPSGRQLADARGIYLVSGSELDLPYLQYWAERIEVADLLASVLRD